MGVGFIAIRRIWGWRGWVRVKEGGGEELNQGWWCLGTQRSICVILPAESQSIEANLADASSSSLEIGTSTGSGQSTPAPLESPTKRTPPSVNLTAAKEHDSDSDQGRRVMGSRIRSLVVKRLWGMMRSF